MLFFCCLDGSVFFFVLFGRGRGPRPNSKKKHDPAQTAKTTTRPRPFRACCFLLFGRVGVFVFFCCLGRRRVFFFAVWAGCVFFLLFGRGRVLFLLFGRGACSFFLLFGRGACFLFAVWAGGVFFFLLFGQGTGVHSLSGLPGSSSSDPTTTKTKQQKKTRVPTKPYRFIGLSLV